MEDTRKAITRLLPRHLLAANQIAALIDASLRAGLAEREREHLQDERRDGIHVQGIEDRRAGADVRDETELVRFLVHEELDHPEGADGPRGSAVHAGGEDDVGADFAFFACVEDAVVFF